MTSSVSKVKEFFAKGVSWGTQDRLTSVGFADDKLDSTQFITISSMDLKSSSKKRNYVVRIDTRENESPDAIASFELRNDFFQATFEPQAISKLGFSSVKIAFTPLSSRDYSSLKKTLESLVSV